ncbi:mannose-ethanolamine phosphotransferase gpi13 [Rhizina undulata]
MDNKSTNGPSEFEGIAAQFAAAKKRAEQENQLTTGRSKDPEVKRRNEYRMKAFQHTHGLLVCLLLSFFYLHAVGIFLFTRGFLLTRLVLDQKSNCSVSPLEEYGDIGETSPDGCWHPRTFDKAVVIVIDALRFDFTVPFEPKDNSTPVHHFHNAFTSPYRITSEYPENAVLLPFIADPPTTTLQRLKGLTTGTLPTFIDAGSNFAGNAIDEDNIIAQLRSSGKRIAFLGDDTWMALFPGYFEENLTHPYDSLNVWDLHSVDNGVNEHIFPLLHPTNSSKWDVLIGHYLGVDHAGHRYGPDHFAMADKLKQMDDVVTRLAESIDNDTLLIVMGDHGMDSKGDHGGESQGEVEAALWMYSKKPVFGRFPGKEERSVAQIDLVPTLSLLLGLPIPFNNLGAPIAEAFLGDGDEEGLKNLAQVSRLTAAQIRRYQRAYSGIKEEEAGSLIYTTWKSGKEKWEEYQRKSGQVTTEEWLDVFLDFFAFQQETLRICRNLWARFDLVSMGAGVLVLAGSVLVLAIYARGFTGDRTELTDTLLERMRNGGAIGAIASAAVWLLPSSTIGISMVHLILFSTAIGLIVGFLSASIYARRRLTSFLPTTSWGFLSFIFTALHSVMFGSNSFTIWEDKTLTFFLSTFAVAGFVASQRKEDLTQRMLGSYHSVILFILTRLASFSKLCREEQIPYCKSTFYASATSSVSAPWSLASLFLMAIFLPAIIKSFYRGSKSYEGPAPVYIGWAFRAGLFLSAIYWTLDSADNGNWLDMDEKVLKGTKMAIAQVVIAMGLFAGNLGYAWSTLCLRVDVEETRKDVKGADGKITSESGRSVLILGYANVHGSRYFLLVVSWALALILLQKPMGGLSMGILLWQILSVVEIIDCCDLSESSIGPVVLGILGNSHFFSTGHQATLSAIQWESAFIPFDSVRYPWSPLLVVANTLGPQILTAIAVPLVVLWKAPPKPQHQLSKVAVAATTHMLYHSVVALSSVACAGWLRRHLMLYRIFSPRYMLSSVVLLVVDLTIALVAVMGLRWNVLAVAEVFGF